MQVEYMKNMIFLLGGHDLEMCTIREVLEKQEILCFDHCLRWDNAYLSSYQDVLKKYGEVGSSWVIYGVELQEDISVPANYVAIDHHNDCAHLPSALEQVLDILHISLDRYLSLVAANDKAYIPGMEVIGATPEEIEEIREADRKAQGVTREEEILALKAVSEHREIIGRLTIIHAFTSSFSPICDRLYPYRSLLIYTDQEWMFYGEGADRVRSLFENEYLSGYVFFGGGRNGYVGVKQGAFGTNEIHNIVERIKDYMYEFF